MMKLVASTESEARVRAGSKELVLVLALARVSGAWSATQCGGVAGPDLQIGGLARRGSSVCSHWAPFGPSESRDIEVQLRGRHCLEIPGAFHGHMQTSRLGMFWNNMQTSTLSVYYDPPPGRHSSHGGAGSRMRASPLCHLAMASGAQAASFVCLCVLGSASPSLFGQVGVALQEVGVECVGDRVAVVVVACNVIGRAPPFSPPLAIGYLQVACVCAGHG